MRSQQLQKQVNELWTSQDLAPTFDVSNMTLHLWRRNRGLPAVVLPGKARPAVRFVPDDVLQWAKQHKVRIRSHRVQREGR